MLTGLVEKKKVCNIMLFKLSNRHFSLVMHRSNVHSIGQMKVQLCMIASL